MKISITPSLPFLAPVGTALRDCPSSATDELPPQVSSLVSPDRDGLEELNALCRAIEPLNAEQREIDVDREVLSVIERLQLHAVVVDHTVWSDHTSPGVLSQAQREMLEAADGRDKGR